jgi:hypothetical protein
MWPDAAEALVTAANGPPGPRIVNGRIGPGSKAAGGARVFVISRRSRVAAIYGMCNIGHVIDLFREWEMTAASVLPGVREKNSRNRSAMAVAGRFFVVVVVSAKITS